MNSQHKFEADGLGALRNSGALHSENNEVGAHNSAPPGPQDHSTTMEEIWRMHASQLLRLTLRITRNREDAEDALQDSFLRAHIYLRRFDGRSHIATWLTRIAINSALMILRKRVTARQVSIDDPAVSAAAPFDLSPNPEQQYAQLEQKAKVSQHLAALRTSLRQALELRTTEQRSIKQIAEKMGLSLSATKSRIFHAKAALRKSLGSKVSRRSTKTKQLQLSRA